MNKKYLLYVGLFVAGAVITPMYLSLFGSGDRPSQGAAEKTPLTDNSNGFNTADGSVATPKFAPDDSREQIEQDYTIQQPAVQTATTLPQFARNQSPPAPYPNYGAISTPRLMVPDLPTPKPAIAPSTSPQSTSETLSGLSQDRAIALNTTNPFPSEETANPRNSLLAPLPPSDTNQSPTQQPQSSNNPDSFQGNWLQNNRNRPAVTGSPFPSGE